MSDAWKRIDLEGGGLQAANRALHARLKRRDRAWLAWLGFPLGLHRAYLDDRRGTWAWRVATLGVLGLAWFEPHAALGAAGVLLAIALVELALIERRVIARNKALRIEAWLRPAPGAPAGFRGHYTEAAGEDAAAPGSRAPSFAEQERMLAAIAREKKRRSE
ncbi:MAG TPA: hypothetical protein VIS77_12700 [Burkholderiales bacterium]